MSMRFYRRISLGKGATLNLGKTGASLSLGVRGAHMTLGGAGGTRGTVGIPGTGLSWTHNFTAAERRQARCKAKQQRDEAYAAERHQRARDRERKRRKREQAIEQAVREKQMQLAALKSEFEEFHTYLANLSSFHKIDMVHGEQARSEFRSRCEPRLYKNIRFLFDDDAENMSVYHYSEKPELDTNDRQIEDILRANNEELRHATSNLTTLRNIEKLTQKIEKDSNKLNVPTLTFFIGIVLIFFIQPLGLGVAIASMIIGKLIDRKYGISRTKKDIKLQLKSLGLNKKTFPGAVKSIESVINKELNFYADRQDRLDSVKSIAKALRSYTQQSFGPDFLKWFDSPYRIQQQYNSYTELREDFEIWMNPEQHKKAWLENEEKRAELLQKADACDKEAISTLCEALLPLSIDVTHPSWLDAVSLQEYEVAYHVEAPEEAWLLIELPDVAIIPEYSAQLSPGGNRLTYPAMTERNRFTLYDKCAASFSLIHAQLLYLTFPFFKKIWIESYTMILDSATGMPRRKDIVQGYIDTEHFTKFNFNNADPVEAIKALKVNFFPLSTKQFVEPTWADDDERIVWASREGDVPDGLLPF